MADVSIYVAVIAASSAVLGAAVAPVGTAYQVHVQAKRDQRERRDTALRQACMDLLRAASDLRTQVANNHEYHGNEMAVRLAQVRQYAANAGVHALSIALQAKPRLADPARRLAEAADRLAVATAENTKLDMGRSIRAPDFTELDACVAGFSASAVEYTRG